MYYQKLNHNNSNHHSSMALETLHVDSLFFAALEPCDVSGLIYW